MAGHSKWAQIRRKKSVTDTEKSRVFSRLTRLIALESRKAGGDVNASGLSAAITRAKAANMPKENIERFIAKGISKDSDNLEQIIYEAYGPGGIPIIITSLTDNKNRTAQEIKHLLSVNNLELASPGAASWAFTVHDGIYKAHEPLIEVRGADEDRLRTILEALDAHDDVQRVATGARGYEDSGD